ncbi:MAG TPA: BON domain-containing protein [Bacteriovoracaceae bacterium]|nr:BON domain-containing protein [Bacteriovoracaceae bacterium]
MKFEPQSTDARSQKSFSIPGIKGWNRPDEAIQEAACEALWRNQKLNATKIEVSVDDGVVTLGGTVDRPEFKGEAEQCVQSLPGVTEVINELSITA